MGALNRREILVGAAAVAAVTAIPVQAAAATAPVAEILPAWAVGSEGEFNWQHIVARTEREAQRIFVCDNGYDDFEEECAHDSHEDGCDCCDVLAAFDAQRIPRWDGLSRTTNADWLRANMGSLCSRCGYETFREEGGHPVGDEAVCSDCMTLADWDVVDPQRAAEIRADMAEDSA